MADAIKPTEDELEQLRRMMRMAKRPESEIEETIATLKAIAGGSADEES